MIILPTFENLETKSKTLMMLTSILWKWVLLLT